MRIRSAARAASATAILVSVLAPAVMLAAGCAAPPAPPARPAVWMSLTTVPGTGLTLTQAGGGLYASWQVAAPGAAAPQMVLARLDPRTGAPAARNTFSPGSLGTPLAADGALWVTDSGALGRFLLRLDPATLMVTGELKFGGPAGPGAAPGAAAAFAGGWLWVDGGDELLRVSPVTVEPAAAIALRGARSSGVAASQDGSVLVVSEAGQSGAWLQRRDPRTGALLAAHRVPGDVVIDGVAGSGVWVTPPAGSARAERYRTDTMTQSAAVIVRGDGILVAGGLLWVTGGPGRGYCADPSSGRRLAALPGGGPPRARLLAVAGRVLYYAEPVARGARIAAVPVPAGCG